MGTITDKLNYLKETKSQIKQALINKGQAVSDTDTFRSYANKISNIETGGGSEWQPQSDWWDIKKIVEEDTEDYPAKAIFLLTDTTLKQNFSQNNFFNADKIKFSDGQEITENGTYTIKENGLKQCAQGYKTYYVIVYLKTTTINFAYTNMTSQFKASKFIYFYNVKKLQCNSAWNLSYYNRELEAWLSNEPFEIQGNMSFIIKSAFQLQKLPNISLFNRGTTPFSHASIIGLSDVPKLKKEEIIKVFSNFSSSDSGGSIGSIVNTFFDETIDLEQDFNIIPSKITKYTKMQCMKEIVELDFANATSVERSGFCVRDAKNIKNIVRSNNYFECNNTSYGSIIISRDTLLKVLDALYDYSTSEDTYTLTLGTFNLEKLTEEEKAIATNKGWTLA